MHDPMSLVLHVKGINLDVWHTEPGGADAFTVCGTPPNATAAALWWAVRHWRHLHYRWWPYLNVRRWICDRCAGCGRRFLWRDARCSYMGSDQVWHEPCMSLRHVRGQLNDIDHYVLGSADCNTRWRVEYRLKLGAYTGDDVEV